MIRSLLTLILFGVCICFPLLAQTTLTGTVKGDDGNALPGVSIVVKGTTRGTATNSEGGYTLAVSPEDVLVVSFIGYVRQEVPVGNRATLDIVLRTDMASLDEVVVVGYGTQQREDITTAISSVSAKDIARMPVASLDQAIQGRAPGVQVTKGTGAPGGAVSIRIRGTASINGGQEPLYVIDGVPINNSFTGSPQAGNDVINGMAGINPEDIASVEILKDAASASIYGARAANGVVLITTKRGAEGKAQVSLNLYSGVQALTRRYDLLNADQFAAAVNEGRIRANQPPVYTQSPGSNTNWQDEVIRPAPLHNAYLTLSGGSKNSQYLVALGYFNQQGVIINSGFERYNFRANVDQKVGERIKLGTSLMLSRSSNNRLRNTGDANVQANYNNNNVYGPSVLSSALVFNPTVPVTDPQTGNYGIDTLTALSNPVALAEEAELQSVGLRLIGNVFAEIGLFKGLRFRTSWGADIRNENENFFFPATPGTGGSGQLQNRTFDEALWLTENYVNYDLGLGDHRLNLLGGFSLQESANQGNFIRATGVDGQIRTVDGGTQVFNEPVGNVRWGMESLFARLNYNYQSKYLLSGTIRRDGSSRFGPNRKHGVFPSFSAGWIISNEAFMQTVPFISNLKIRGSYGVTGNDQIDPYGWRASVERLAQNYLGQAGSVARGIVNQDYSWEETRQTNLGLDVSLLQGRLNLTTEYYIKRSDGLLLDINLPWTSGFGTFLGNAGSMENRGWEFQLGGDVLRAGDFRWNASFNISFNRNKVLSLTEGLPAIATGSYGISNIARPGQPISFQLYQVEETVNPETGDFIFKDVGGPENGGPDGRIDNNDLKIVGSPLPVHFGGFNHTLSYKNFDLAVFFQWSYGNDIYNETRAFVEDVSRPTISAIGNNLSRQALDRWTRPGDAGRTFRGINYGNNYVSQPIDRYLEDGSYLRLKNVSLGYTLPGRRLGKSGIESLRVYATANNLLTFTRYSGFDPEVNHNIDTNVGIGIDSGTFPQAQTYLFGLNVTF